MDSQPNSQEDQNLEAISQLPIPPYALAWDPTVVRPAVLPERYDTRIAAKYIFFLPSKKIYIVSQRCDGCTKSQQACDRALPGCARCVRAKTECHVSDKTYVILPKPKVERMKRWTSDIVKRDGRPRISSESARAKRKVSIHDESPRQKKRKPSGESLFGSKASAAGAKSKSRDPSATGPTRQQSKVTPVSTKTGRRKPEKARYLVSKPDTLAWDIVHPPKTRNCPEASPSAEGHKLPQIWAASRNDLLAALPTHPDIFQYHGLGYQGGFIDFLILEGQKWDDDNWTGSGTIHLTRKWRFTRKVRTESPSVVQNSHGQASPVKEKEHTQNPVSSDTQNPTDPFSADGWELAPCPHLEPMIGCTGCPTDPTQSSLHSEGWEMTLCPHLEPLNKCPQCPAGFQHRLPIDTLPENGNETDDSDDCGSDTSNAISLTKYTSHFTIDISSMVGNRIRNDISRYDRTYFDAVSVSSPPEDASFIRGQPFGNCLVTSSDQGNGMPFLPRQLKNQYRAERNNEEDSLRPGNLELPWRREALWRQERLWRDEGTEVPYPRSTLMAQDASGTNMSLVYPGNDDEDDDGTPNLVIVDVDNDVSVPENVEKVRASGDVYLTAPATAESEVLLVSPGQTDTNVIPNLVPSDTSVDTSAPQTVEPAFALDELPMEADLFRNAVNTKGLVRVIVASDSALLPFTLAPGCAYAFLGFFAVVEFETILPLRVGNGSGDTVSLKVTLEWRPGGNGHPDSTPWWTSEKPHIGRIERYAMPCFPGISSYPAEISEVRPRRPTWVAVETDDSSDEDPDSHAHDSSPAWHCLCCGKLNVVAPFRSGWSWKCSCGAVGRTGKNQVLALDMLRDPYGLTPPLPVPDPEGNIKHTLSAGPQGEEYITYKFVGTDVLLQHIPIMQQPVVTHANILLEKLQAQVDFEPVDSDSKCARLRYHLASRLAFLKASKAAQDVWCFMESLITGRFGLDPGVVCYARELLELHCIAWLSKGATKNQESPSGYTLFLSTGASLTLKISIRKPGEPVKIVPLEMPHGSLLFLHNAQQPIHYDVQHTGPSLLLAGRWKSHAPKEELMVEETLGRA